MKKKIFSLMILLICVVSSVFATTDIEGVWGSEKKGSDVGAISMIVRLDLSDKRDAEYAVAFTSEKINSYSQAMTNVDKITLVPNTETMKFNDYGGDDKLYISYKFKENEKVGLYLQLDSGLVNSDKSIDLAYKASFTVDGDSKELTSSTSTESVKVRDFADEGKVGATVFGSYALVLSAEDSFKEAVTQNLTSTMKLIVQSEV